MSTRCSNFQRAFDVLLTFHIRKIDLIVAAHFKNFVEIDVVRRDFFHAVQKIDRLAQIIDREHFQFFDHRGFANIFGGHQQSFHAHLANHPGDGKHAVHRAHGAIQRQFTDDDVILQPRFGNFAIGSQQTDGNWQIVTGTFFANICRRQIDGRSLLGQLVTGIFDGGSHPFPALPNGGIGQSDHRDVL